MQAQLMVRGHLLDNITHPHIADDNTKTGNGSDKGEKDKQVKYPHLLYQRAEQFLQFHIQVVINLIQYIFQAQLIPLTHL